MKILKKHLSGGKNVKNDQKMSADNNLSYGNAMMLLFGTLIDNH